MFIAALLTLWPGEHGHAQSSAAVEQERLVLIQVLKRRLPGTGPADWHASTETLTSEGNTVVQAIPFNSENATNSADILAIGKKMWDRKFNNGRTLSNCFANGGRGVAASFPQFDAKSKQVLTIEMAINRCLGLHAEPEIPLRESGVIGPLSAYFKSLSEGQPIKIRVPTPQAREKFDSGRALFQRRMGQQGFACSSCHVINAGEVFGGRNLSPVVGQAASWPHLQPGGRVLGLQAQFQRCMQRSGAEPFELGTEELNNLEYYHTFMSNGLPVRMLAVQR